MEGTALVKRALVKRASAKKASARETSARETSAKYASAKRAWKLLGAMVLMLTFLAGCGGKEEEESTYKEVLKEQEKLQDVKEDLDASEKEDYIYLGTQFCGGVKSQIWGIDTEEGGKVYLHKEGADRELLMEDVHRYFLGGFEWWVDNEGRCFLLQGGRIIRPKMDESFSPTSDWSSCEGAYFQQTAENDEQFADICQLEDGRYIVLREDSGQYKFSEMNPDSGRLDDLVKLPKKEFDGLIDLISAEGNSLLVLTMKGVWEVSLTDGRTDRRVSFGDTTFQLEGDDFQNKRVKEDFRLLEDGRIELLWSDGTVESLEVAEIGEDRETLVLRSSFLPTWLQEQITDFNQQNEKYYIAVEVNEWGGDVKSFRERTDLEIGAGKGADIIVSLAANDINSLLEKKAFADLTPFMDASGLKEEDFFPSAFYGWKDGNGIYGVRAASMVMQFWLDQTVVGERSVSNIEELVDCLLAYEEDAVLVDESVAHCTPDWVLRYFMKHSESLCGMVDFENGTCDFGGELFGKLLEAAKRYGYDERKEKKAVGGVAEYFNFYNFCDDAFLSSIGWVPVGYMSDDGGCPNAGCFVLAINANSDKKEGGWEFLSYLLGEEVQSKFYVPEEKAMLASYVYLPMNRSVFEELCGKHKEVINGGVDDDLLEGYDKVHRTGLTEERKTMLREALESARPELTGTEPVIQIILDEAEAYFTGDRSIEQVRENVENRVQLYLNETR